ncbi:hypothetical protein MRX96_057556 [Rhipicephalus microplus]
MIVAQHRFYTTVAEALGRRQPNYQNTLPEVLAPSEYQLNHSHDHRKHQVLPVHPPGAGRPVQPGSRSIRLRRIWFQTRLWLWGDTVAALAATVDTVAASTEALDIPTDDDSVTLVEEAPLHANGHRETMN